MSLTASFFGFKCPMCGEMIMASDVTVHNNPELAVTICEHCGSEIQVTKNPATGKMEAEKAKKN